MTLLLIIQSILLKQQYASICIFNEIIIMKLTIHTGWPFENETEVILGSSRDLRKNPRTRRFFI